MRTSLAVERVSYKGYDETAYPYKRLCAGIVDHCMGVLKWDTLNMRYEIYESRCHCSHQFCDRKINPCEIRKLFLCQKYEIYRLVIYGTENYIHETMSVLSF